MATIAIGDIHGNLPALEDLLSKVLPELYEGDHLVFLGDAIDRGPDARGCIERILHCKSETRAAVTALMGNHEHWMLESMNDHTRHSWILAMDAFDTIGSYSDEAANVLRNALKSAGVRLIKYKVRLPYDVFFNALPKTHLDFLYQLRPYLKTPDVICVHAGVALDGIILETQSPDSFFWGVNGFPRGYHGPDPVVYGHWDNAVYHNKWPSPNIGLNHTHGLDSIASGVLTAMRFPDRKIYQSARFNVTGQGLWVE